MNICFDTETTGLPIFGTDKNGKRRRYGFPKYTSTEAYDTARLVSISWIISQHDKVVEQSYFVVKPDGYVISPESQAIHGISMEDADRDGVPFSHILEELEKSFSACNALVAHNIDFDSHILKAELYRRAMEEGAPRERYLNLVEKMNAMREICTMKKGKEIMHSRKYPKLGELYQFLYDEEIENAHNAMFDTYYCFQCYKKMFPIDNSLFFFGDRAVRLTEEQRAIVYGDANIHNLVIACAGSGKTTTTLCRIKALVDGIVSSGEGESSAVPEGSILLTTFTRDAANDMRNKLTDIMGYVSEVKVGTIDSIAKGFVDHHTHKRDTHLKDVGEYAPLFLRMIRKDPTIIRKYRYLFVDEFQDINNLQFEIIMEFLKVGTILFAVGDDAQNIYSFRGSNIEYILNFQTHFKNSYVYMLTHNFRSSKYIVEFANACIEHNKNQIPKKMIPSVDFNEDKDIVRPHVAYFETAPGMHTRILNEIKKLLAKKKNNIDEIAVLAPTNQALFPIEEMLTREKIPNTYLDGRADVKMGLQRGKICLTTIHKAKGLEWDNVFMIQVNDEMFPRTKTKEAIEEGRRLFYVGITRARRALRMYYTVYIKEEPYVSRYISEVREPLQSSTDDDALYTFSDNMTPVHFYKKTVDTENTYVDCAVTKMIEQLDGDDILQLRERGILPHVTNDTVTTHTLWKEWTYSPSIVEHDIYSDFGIFVEKVAMRTLKREQGMELIDKHACACVASIKLDAGAYKIYNMYKRILQEGLPCIPEKMFENIHERKSSMMKMLYANSSTHKKIAPSHVDIIISLIHNMYQNAKTYKIAVHEVPVFSERFLPPGFEEVMKQSLRKYFQRESGETEIAGDIWELSKCKKIVAEYRRRLLYKEIDSTSLMKEYEGLVELIQEQLPTFFKERLGMHYRAFTEEEYKIHDANGIISMYGEGDLRLENASGKERMLVDVKSSNRDDIAVAWILQLLCYKMMYEKQYVQQSGDNLERPIIHKIGILNVLRGWYKEVDVSTWNCGDILAEMLLTKSKSKSTRT